MVAEKAIRFRLNCPHGLCRLISSRLFAAAASYRYTACDMTKNQLGIIVQSRTKLMHIVWQCATVKGSTLQIFTASLQSLAVLLVQL